MPKITLHPCTTPEDFFLEAKMEAEAFRHDAFSDVAFGPHRFDDEYCAARGREMEKQPGKGEVIRMTKAVIDETGEVVGFAAWGMVSVEEGGKDVGVYGVGKERKEEMGGKVEGEGGVKLVMCQKLLDDTFIPGDVAMAAACKGGDYYSTFPFRSLPSNCQEPRKITIYRALQSSRISRISTTRHW